VPESWLSAGMPYAIYSTLPTSILITLLARSSLESDSTDKLTQVELLKTSLHLTTCCYCNLWFVNIYELRLASEYNMIGIIKYHGNLRQANISLIYQLKII